jgi:hypothetical protein
MLLRYKFRRGSELVYNVELMGSLLTISEAQARAGGRAAELPVESDKFRMLYAIDNTYSDGDGLLRMQALPNPGKDYIFFKLVESAGGEVLEGRRYHTNEMHPLYMRVNNMGVEKFGAVPLYVPMEGTLGEPVRSDLYVVFPFPTLPEKAVKPGDAWQSRFQFPMIDLDKLYETKKIMVNVPARGELVGVEWEMGHPCAKVRNSLSQASLPRPGARPDDGGRDNIGVNRVSVEQTTWFALDTGLPVKIVFDTTRDVRAAASDSPGMAGSQGGGPTFGAGTGGGDPRREEGPPAFIGDELGMRQGQGKFGGGGGGLTQGGGGAGNTFNPGGQGRQGGAGGGRAQTQYLRLRYRVTMTLAG